MPATQPTDLGAFWRTHPSFVWGPAAVIGAFQAFLSIPKVAAFVANKGLEPYGWENTAMYTGFAIILSYATHAWYAVHVSQDRQLQSFETKAEIRAGKAPSTYAERQDLSPGSSQAAAATRTVAAVLTSVVYAFVPFAAPTYSLKTFVAANMAFAIYWDLHFFIVHKMVHENGTLYRWIHKLHHSHKAPGVFTAYFVTYQSHFLTEQSVVMIGALAGLPRNVFTWIMWWGTLATFVEHGGHDVADIKLTPLPITFGQLCTCFAPWGLVLGGTTPAEHDWHHEKFTTNYALNFPYLDKLFGSFHPGRVPGEAVAEQRAPKKADDAAAEDDVAQGQTMAVDEDGMPIVVKAAAAAAKAPLPPAAAAEGAPVEATPAQTDAVSPTLKRRTAPYTDPVESTTEDLIVQGAAFDAYKESGNIVRNVMRLVTAMKGELGEIGARVDMYEHSLQTATRARRAGADTETVVCALLHDIGEVLSGTNHGEIAASVLRPYISPKNYWLLSNHEVFQAYHFLDKCGGDKNLRDTVREYTEAGIVKGHEYYDATETFCLEYNRPSFDETYDTDPIESFVPLVTEVFDRKPFWWEPKDKITAN